MRTPEGIARGVMKRSAVAFDRVRPAPPGVVVLLYHRVSSVSNAQMYLPRGMFAKQIAKLAHANRVVSLSRALEMLSGSAPPPTPTPVVLTFDDGTEDFTKTVVPILQEFDVPATLYAATSYIEERRAFPDGAKPTSWAALADACSTGLVDVGSHTHSHRLLDRCPPQDVADELDRSIGCIQERLGRAALDFAYPKAVPGSSHAEAAVKSRFRSAALAGTRANPYGRTDPYRLARSPIQRSDGMRWYAHKVAGHMRLEDDLRHMLNRVRYSRAKT